MSFKHPSVLPKEFFLKVRQLSQPKLRIYQSYLKTFINNLSSHEEGIVFDGFAGQGVYKNIEMKTDMVDLGSPLLALMPGIEYLNKYKRANLKYIFVEKNEENFKVLIMNVLQCIHALLDIDTFKLISYTDRNLQKIEIIDEKNRFISVEINNGEFKDHVERFCEIKPNQRLLSLVDPFGYKDLDIENIESLAGKNKEILITFMAGLMKRYRQIETHQDTISNILNVDKEELVDLNTEIKISVQFGNRLNESNTSMIDPLYLKIKNRCNATVYVLIFITNDRYASQEMNKCFIRNSNNTDEYEFSLLLWQESNKTSGSESDNDVIFDKIVKNEKVKRLIECKTISK